MHVAAQILVFFAKFSGYLIFIEKKILVEKNDG